MSLQVPSPCAFLISSFTVAPIHGLGSLEAAGRQASASPPAVIMEACIILRHHRKKGEYSAVRHFDRPHSHYSYYLIIILALVIVTFTVPNS